MKHRTTTVKRPEPKKRTSNDYNLPLGEIIVGFFNSAHADKSRPLSLLFSDQLPRGYDKLRCEAWLNGREDRLTVEERDANWCRRLLKQAWPAPEAQISTQKLEFALHTVQAYAERYPELSKKYELTEKLDWLKKGYSLGRLKRSPAFWYAEYDDLRKCLL